MRKILLIDYKYETEKRFDASAFPNITFYEDVPGFRDGCPKTYNVTDQDVALIILHTSNNCAEHFYTACKDKVKNWGFYSGDEPPNWVGDAPFFTVAEVQNHLSDFEKEFKDGNDKPPFEVLKYGSHGARIVKAHRLRYEVLTPFIAFHLSLQAYREDDNKDALMIDEIKRPENYRSRENLVQELLSLPCADGNSIIDSDTDAYQDHFEDIFSDPALTKLFTYLENGELPEKNDASLKTVISNIDVFAHNMEQAVSFIEFGDSPEWK